MDLQYGVEKSAIATQPSNVGIRYGRFDAKYTAIVKSIAQNPTSSSSARP